MMRTFTGFLIVVLAVSGACAQSVTGRISGTLSGGHRSNTYLDSGLRTWFSSTDLGFLDLRSSGALAWNGSRSTLQVSASGVSGLLTGDRPRAGAVHVNGSYQLGSSWTAGPLLGVRSVEIVRERRSRWIGSFVRWHPGGGFTLDLQPAWSRQTVFDSMGGERSYEGWMGLVRARYWLSGRWRIQTTGYLSDSDRPADAAGYRGSGLEAQLRYWPSAGWRLTAEADMQQIDYRFGGDEPGSSRQFLAEAGLELTRSVGDRAEFFARARVLGYENAESSTMMQTDQQFSGGMRMRLAKTLWRSNRSDRRRVWQQGENGVRLRVRYEGSGRLYLTGSFSDWDDPGRPLERIEEGIWGLTMELPEGRYEYAIRVVGDERRDWLELPESALVVDDGFGRENGVLYIEGDVTGK